jgi:hypothetical protein
VSQRSRPSLITPKLQLDTNVSNLVLHHPARPLVSQIQQEASGDVRMRYPNASTLGLLHKLEQLSKTVEEGDHREVESTVLQQTSDCEVS